MARRGLKPPRRDTRYTDVSRWRFAGAERFLIGPQIAEVRFNMVNLYGKVGCTKIGEFFSQQHVIRLRSDLFYPMRTFPML